MKFKYIVVVLNVNFARFEYNLAPVDSLPDLPAQELLNDGGLTTMLNTMGQAGWQHYHTDPAHDEYSNCIYYFRQEI